MVRQDREGKLREERREKGLPGVQLCLPSAESQEVQSKLRKSVWTLSVAWRLDCPRFKARLKHTVNSRIAELHAGTLSQKNQEGYLRYPGTLHFLLTAIISNMYHQKSQNMLNGQRVYGI